MLTLPRKIVKGPIALLVAATLTLPLIISNPAHSGITAPIVAKREAQPVKVAIPVQLTIPAAAIDAPIEAKGTTPQGNMEAPIGPHTTSWYKFGPRPGAIGSAVIAGHFGRWKDGEGSVFDTLHTLKKGDKVYIKNSEGTVIAFTVRETRILGRTDDATNVFISKDGKAHLNLITCEGTWDNSKKTYSNRLVVFTDL